MAHKFESLTHEERDRQRGIAKLRVNIKSLAAEAKIIRHEKNKKPWLAGMLMSHKMFAVRPEARHAQLALAALRGVPYEQVERDAKTEPDWTRVKAKVARVCYTSANRERVDKWIAAARANRWKRVA